MFGGRSDCSKSCGVAESGKPKVGEKRVLIDRHEHVCLNSRQKWASKKIRQMYLLLLGRHERSQSCEGIEGLLLFPLAGDRVKSNSSL
jgi:hypothetical protein